MTMKKATIPVLVMLVAVAIFMMPSSQADSKVSVLTKSEHSLGPLARKAIASGATDLEAAFGVRTTVEIPAGADVADFVSGAISGLRFSSNADIFSNAANDTEACGKALKRIQDALNDPRFFVWESKIVDQGNGVCLGFGQLGFNITIRVN